MQNQELKIIDIGVGYIIELAANILIPAHTIKKIEYKNITLELNDSFGLLAIPSANASQGGYGFSDLSVSVRINSLSIYNQGDEAINRYTIPTMFFVPKF